MILVIFISASFADEDVLASDILEDGEYLDVFNAPDFDERVIFDEVECSQFDSSFIYDIYNLNEYNVRSNSIQASDLVMYYKNGSAFRAQFFNSGGTPLVGAQVSISVNGGSYARITDSNGFVSKVIELEPGYYPIYVYNGNDGSSATYHVTVLSTIVASDLVKYYRNGSNFQFTLLDGHGAPLPGVSATLNINGVLYTRTTNSNGVGTFQVTLNPGKYTITVTNSAGLMSSYLITVLPTLISEGLTKFQSDNKCFELKVVNGQGVPISGATVAMNVNGVISHVTSDSNGIARLNVNFAAGNYIVTSYYGNAEMSHNIYIYHNMVHDYSNLKLIPITHYSYPNEKYKVRLSESNHLPLEGEVVTVFVGSTPYYATTNREGIAEFDLNLPVNTYYITSRYGSLQTTQKLVVGNVISLPVKITAQNTVVSSGGYFYIKVTDFSNIPISGLKISLFFNGEDYEYSRTTDDNGLAKLAINQNSNVYCISFSSKGTTSSGYGYMTTNGYKLIYVSASYDADFVNYTDFGVDDWIDPTNYINSHNNLGIGDPISDTESVYMVNLSNYLTGYEDDLENVISINSYLASINYMYYTNHNKSAIDVFLSFSGNCVDQTNIFVSLARIARLPARYVSLNSTIPNNVGHMVGQVFIDNKWITVDNSEAYWVNGAYVNAVGSRQLGNKNHISSNFILDRYLFVLWGFNENMRGY